NLCPYTVLIFTVLALDGVEEAVGGVAVAVGEAVDGRGECERRPGGELRLVAVGEPAGEGGAALRPAQRVRGREAPRERGSAVGVAGRERVVDRRLGRAVALVPDARAAVDLRGVVRLAAAQLRLQHLREQRVVAEARLGAVERRQRHLRA